MATITREVRIHAAKDHVWAIAADIPNVYKYHPNVPASHGTSNQNQGPGASRHCEFISPAGGSVEERVVEWQEGERYRVEVYGGVKMPPITNLFAEIAVRADGNDTIATMTLNYDTKLGPLGVLMNKLMLETAFTKVVSGIVAGLKHYAETGETVDSLQHIQQDLTLVAAV